VGTRRFNFYSSEQKTCPPLPQGKTTMKNYQTKALLGVSLLALTAWHMLSNLKYLVTGTFSFVGAAQAESKVTDAMTGQVLALAADKRIGGGSMAAGFQWKWGDAENAITHWAELAATRLSTWTSGTPSQ
jgi:hypothetical protein